MIQRLLGMFFISAFLMAPALAASGAPDTETFEPMVSNDAVVFGMLITILALVFWTHSLENRFWQRFYRIFPMLLLCYFFLHF